jgi:outer membrane protein TolC
MYRVGIAFVLAACATGAQVRHVTLKQAVDLATQQNPEIAMARLDERKADAAVQVARDTFVPKIGAGSGLAYSSGIPMSIEGSTPSIVQAQASESIFNKRLTNLVAAARENARGAAIGTSAKRDEVVLRTALAYLDAERSARMAETVRKEVESLEKIVETVNLRVAEGRELPVEAKRASLDLARSRQRLEALEASREYAEDLLSALLGMDEGQRVRVVVEDRTPAPLPPNEEACVEAALAASTEVRRLESALTAKGFEVRAAKAAKLPTVDLIAQYALLGRFNNYDQFFSKFQRHNGQIGVAFQVPLFAGPGANAQAFQASSEVARLRLQLASTRDNIAIETRHLFEQVKQAESAREVARLDLDVTREQLSVLLAQMEEGRASLRQVEEARLAEDGKWLAFIESSYAVETARFNLLHQTGDLLAALK